MSSRINSLVQSLFQKESLDQCSLQELKQLADQFPYFDIPQLLLAKKLGKGGASGDHGPASLYFQNPLWLERLLSDEQNDAVITPSGKPVNELRTENGDRIAENILADPIAEHVEEEPSRPDESWPVDDSISIVEPQELNKIETGDATIPGSEKKEEHSEPEQHWPVDDYHLLGTVIEKESRQQQSEPEFAEQPEASNEQESMVEQPSGEPPLAIPPFKEIPLTAGNDTPVFEPFHAVDYFASQGIKFKSEEQPADKFGKQLRSFTEWLKTMKRLPTTAIEEAVGQPAISNVEKLAEHSLKEDDVFTEAMAEVWKKQGNTGKAIAIYEKLSLLEPSKSHYFAAKIEDLKKTD